jgi:hypothetical protein
MYTKYYGVEEEDSKHVAYKCSDGVKIIERDVIEIYCLYVSEKYRMKGYGTKLLKESIEYLKGYYNLNDDTILGLHLDPKDKMMSCSYGIYVKLGFNKACISKVGPPVLKKRVEKFDHLMCPEELVCKIKDVKEKGHFFAMFCKIDEFAKSKKTVDTKKLMEDGERLKEHLLERRKLEGNAPYN